MDFNPRSPYGERHGEENVGRVLPAISIHAPLTGSDINRKGAIQYEHNFNPRSPYGERPRLRRNPPAA